MEGKGYWEDEFTQKSKLIPGVNSKIAAEIGTDLKYRLEKEFPTKYNPFSKLPYFINFNNKARLVKEALDKVKELSDEYNEQKYSKFSRIKRRPSLTRLINPVSTRRSLTPQQLYEISGRVTGRLGKEVQRTLPERYPEITDLLQTPNLFGYTTRLIGNTNLKENRKLLHPGIKFYDLSKEQPISWGKYNVLLLGSPKHTSVLIRKLTDPISYEWYDPQGKSYTHPRSSFLPFVSKIFKLVGKSPVSINTIRHQDHAALCHALSIFRSLRPDLTNQEYHDDIEQKVANIINNPQSYVGNQETYFIHEDPITRISDYNLDTTELTSTIPSRSRIRRHIESGHLRDIAYPNDNPSFLTSYADTVITPYVSSMFLNKFSITPDIKEYKD